jgi:hypothetical protein
MDYSFPDRRFGANDENVHSRTIKATVAGTMTFVEVDAGPWVEQHSPVADYDYEALLTVKDANLEQLLVALMKERFAEQAALRKWLDSEGLAYDFSTW